MGNPCPNQVRRKGSVHLSYHKFREELKSFLHPGHFPGPLISDKEAYQEHAELGDGLFREARKGGAPGILRARRLAALSCLLFPTGKH